MLSPDVHYRSHWVMEELEDRDSVAVHAEEPEKKSKLMEALEERVAQLVI